MTNRKNSKNQMKLNVLKSDLEYLNSRLVLGLFKNGDIKNNILLSIDSIEVQISDLELKIALENSED